MKRLDHIAYRVNNRYKTSQFFQDAFHYTVQTEFDIVFPDESKAQCIVLQPPEKVENAPWLHTLLTTTNVSVYHTPPELFISDGSEESVVGKWVLKRDNVGGIHHIAYQVESVARLVQEWERKGYAEFATDEPVECRNLKQIFTKPSVLTGVIYEFIER